MGILFSLSASEDTRRRRLRDLALAPDILLGMPHLTPFGLSETWLLKELAHRHWLLLGEQMGLDDADFRADDGGEIYAAICASSLTDGAGLEQFGANDILTIASSMEPVGYASTSSRHVLLRDGLRLAEVELISTFVQRLEAGRNASIARVRARLLPGGGTPNTLAQRARAVRQGDLSSLGALPAAPADLCRPFHFLPVPIQDFNGAGLLYFAHFQGVFDRALSSWGEGSAPSLLARDIYYLGNIDAGQPVTVALEAVSADGRSLHMSLCDPAGNRLALEAVTFAQAWTAFS